MKDINKVILVGRLGDDPSFKEFESGVRVANFPVATSKKYKKTNQSSNEVFLHEETEWHRIVTWGRYADSCVKYLKKGQPVYIEGSLKTRNATDKEGNKKYFVEIHANEISFLPSTQSA